MKAIDLFAGAGGATLGATMAGVEVLWAANHWPDAVRYHAENHPHVEHSCQDLHQADWSKVPSHDLLLASPACQGHSRARGKDLPRHDDSRSTAWAVISALEFHRSPFAVVENVPDFLSWQLYPVWSQALAALGYSYNPIVVDAAHTGLAQNRERLFILITRSRHPIQIKMPRRRTVTAGEVIDFKAGNWSPIDKPGRSPAQLARVTHGRKHFGSRFLTPYYSEGSGKKARSLDRPIGTITTHDRWGVVDGDVMRMVSTSEARKFMGFPESYHLPTVKRAAMKMLGNAVPPPLECDVITAFLKAV